MGSIFIQLSSDAVYVARTHPDSASENPLTTQELVILDLHNQVESLKREVKNLQEYTKQNAKQSVTDEEIEEEAKQRHKIREHHSKHNIARIESNRAIFIHGANWMRNKLTNK